jgi:hypothetical protein
MQYIAFDSHKHYTLARVENADDHRVHEARIAHERGALKEFGSSSFVVRQGGKVAEAPGRWSGIEG